MDLAKSPSPSPSPSHSPSHSPCCTAGGIDIGAPAFQRGRNALSLLYDACCYARQLDRSLWDFAEEIASLRQGGLTNGDLRWLICNGLVEHGREITKLGEEHREFQRAVGLHFSKKTCFVLTNAGTLCVKECLTQSASSKLNATVQPTTPIWDRDLQELRLGNQIVKRFKVPAPNQETVLAVFQEENWPVYIDDPLPPHPNIDPKSRLHDTINSLNRNQQENLIQFRGNGSGKGVRWELVGFSESTD